MVLLAMMKVGKCELMHYRAWQHGGAMQRGAAPLSLVMIDYLCLAV